MCNLFIKFAFCNAYYIKQIHARNFKRQIFTLHPAKCEIVEEAPPQRDVEQVRSTLFYIWYMYSKQEAAQLRKEFWTAFGQYMTPVLSAEGEKISWVNYKTGEKNIFFRMEADGRNAVVAIELTHADRDIQQIYYEQFLQLQKFLEEAKGEEWMWQLHTSNEYGKTVSRIFTSLQGVSIFKKQDWPALISFFKTKVMALDEFWSNVKYSFEALR